MGSTWVLIISQLPNPSRVRSTREVGIFSCRTNVNFPPSPSNPSVSKSQDHRGTKEFTNSPKAISETLDSYDSVEVQLGWGSHRNDSVHIWPWYRNRSQLDSQPTSSLHRPRVLGKSLCSFRPMPFHLFVSMVLRSWERGRDGSMGSFFHC